MTGVAFPILLMLVLVMAEMVVLNRENRQQINWHDVVFNLNSGHLMLWLFRGLEIAVYGMAFHYLGTGIVTDWPAPVLWIFALIAWDFCFYWLHRLHHKYATLWAIHVVHHEGEHFNLSLAVRNSWYSSLGSIPFFLPMAILGVPLDMFVTVSIVHYGIQMMNHSALTPHLGFLERILVTPAHHRIHHVADRAWSDSNYAGSFVIWDHLFGTYRPDLPEGDFRYGVKGAAPSLNPALASNSPFLRYVLRLKQRHETARPEYQAHGLTVLTGTLLLYGLVIGYIWLYGYQYADDGYTQIIQFFLIASGAIVLGSISEGRRWALYAWGTIMAALAFHAIYAGLGAYFIWVSVALLLHGVLLLSGVGRSDVAQQKYGAGE